MAKSFALEGIDWLGFDSDREAVLFRSDFDFPANVTRVTAEILTHGFFEAYLNGERISDDLFVPAWTNYNKQDYTALHMPNFDTYCYRSYYLRYDMTAAAKEGKNAFAVHIGDGWYGQWECENEGILPYGEKKLCFRITVVCADGATHVFSSNDGGVFRPSYMTRTSMYFGETHDLRKCSPDFFCCALNDPACRPVKTVARPETLIQRQLCPPDRVLRRITAPAVLSAFGDRKIYDLGENTAGFAVLRFSKNAERGARVSVRYAENLNADGSLNFHSTGGSHRLSVDEFRLGDDNSVLLFPRFLWHAGRYVEVTGDADFVCFCVAASDVPVTASFRSSDPLLNWLFDAYLRTQTANIHTCVPSDCPHRERLGYTGDGQLTAAAVMTTYDARALYRKWMRDIADCQDIETGHVPHTAPFYGGGGGPGGWGCAIVEVPYRYWKFYGDDGVLRTYYPHMKKYLDYLASRCDGHIIMREEPDGWCLGDWCTPHSGETGIQIPAPFVNTYFYLRSLRQVMEIAPFVGAAADLPGLHETEAAVAAALRARFFDDATGSFCGGVCGADAFALDLGLGDGRTLQNLVSRYRESGTFDTGIFGTPLVLKVLFERGFAADAFRLLTNAGEVSFRRMMESGATTLWEEWFNENSSSHPMFGAAVEFLFKYLLGIRQPAGEAGFRHVLAEPCAVPALAWAEGSVVLGGKRVSVRVEQGKRTAFHICE
jgi:alpha-L-rhamnosidase